MNKFIILILITVLFSCDYQQNQKARSIVQTQEARPDLGSGDTTGTISGGHLGSGSQSPEVCEDVFSPLSLELSTNTAESLEDYLDLYYQEAVQILTADEIDSNGLSSDVYDTKVRYENLYTNQDKLFLIRQEIESKFDKVDYSSLSTDAKVALLINAYNYYTIQIVVKNFIKSNGAQIKSIKDVTGGTFEVFDKNFDFVKISGQSLNLNQIEKQFLLKDVLRGQDARPHFAVICASEGCPTLLHKAYREEIVNTQLDCMTEKGLLLSRVLETKENSTELIELFDWYNSDFVNQEGSVVKFLAKYLPSNSSISSNLKVPSDYDWNLNIYNEVR